VIQFLQKYEDYLFLLLLLDVFIVYVAKSLLREAAGLLMGDPASTHHGIAQNETENVYSKCVQCNFTWPVGIDVHYWYKPCSGKFKIDLLYSSAFYCIYFMVSTPYRHSQDVIFKSSMNIIYIYIYRPRLSFSNTYIICINYCSYSFNNLFIIFLS
jgi:hypothetical protein